MLKVCHFANTLVSKPGYIGVRTERIIRALSESGGGGYCLSRKFYFQADGFVFRDMGWLAPIPRILKAIKIYAIPRFNFRLPAIRLFEWFALSHLSEALSTHPDVVHVWDSCPRLMSELKRKGCLIVLDVPIAPKEYVIRASELYGLDFFRIHQNSLGFHHDAYAIADIILAPSLFVAEELHAIGVDPQKIRVIEFGVDIPINPLKVKNNSVSGEVNFAFVGAVNRRKGVDRLLTVWNDPVFKSDRLHLCGRIYPEILPYLICPSGGAILTPGFIKPFDYLQHCDVFVFPSWLEGSAKAVYEAMACGMPVIVSRSSGSIVRDGIDGFVIEAGDSDALRERMLWFKQHPEQIKCMGQSAKERVQEFSWQRYCDRVINVYQEILQ